MEILFLALAFLAGLVHIYIFILETFLWTKPAAGKAFGITKQYAEATKEMAANQGVYNGALAAVVLAGVAIFMAGNSAVGYSLVFAGTATMVIAATYLFFSSPDKRAAALKQILFPIGALILGVVLNIL